MMASSGLSSELILADAFCYKVLHKLFLTDSIPAEHNQWRSTGIFGPVFHALRASGIPHPGAAGMRHTESMIKAYGINVQIYAAQAAWYEQQPVISFPSYVAYILSLHVQHTVCESCIRIWLF